MQEQPLEQNLQTLMDLQHRLAAYEHAIGLIQYDGATTAPKGTADNRAVSLSVLSEELYRCATGKETAALLDALDAKKDALTAEQKQMVYLLRKDITEMKKIPMQEYVAFQALLAKADDVWHTAKETNDFGLFCPYLEQIFETTRRFAQYVEPDKDPYDHCLSQYEEGLTTQTLDTFFQKLRTALVPLLQKIAAQPQVDDSIRFGDFPLEKQEVLSVYLMKTLGLDLRHVGLRLAF